VPANDDNPEWPAWIESTVKVAAALGMNPVKVRWKLARWLKKRKAMSRRVEQRVDHIQYQHKICDECGAIQDANEKTCTRCGAALGSRRFQVLRRIGLTAPEFVSMSSLLAIAFVACYVKTSIESGNPWNMTIQALVETGGILPLPFMLAAGEYWRVLAAEFLHGGIWHIGFNLLALSILGPRVEELYGRATLLSFFVFTAVIASIGSIYAGLAGVGIGASGGLMGLTGVAMGYGQRDGTTIGRQLRDDMIKWALYVFIFGFAIGADNWAHLFGLLSGAILGYAIRPRVWRKKRLLPVRIVVNGLAIASILYVLTMIFLS
jgi:membrane associated rhomboid family serine protease